VAFPSVVTSVEGAVTTAATSSTVTFPSGSTTGDLILIFFAWVTGSTPTGTESFADISSLGTIWYKQLDGSEGASTVFNHASQRTCWIAYRITGHINPATQAPQQTNTTTASTTTPTSPSLSPTGGAKDYLWFSMIWGGSAEEADDDTWCNSAPTNYGTLLQKTTGTTGAATTNTYLASAQRQLNAASDDPATFSVDVAAVFLAYTVAVHPAAATLALPPIMRGRGDSAELLRRR
jgi:hypothetical protein